MDHRKEKRIVIYELVAIDPFLQFLFPDGSIDDLVWKDWKMAHRVSSATYNILLCRLDKEFFSLRLTNGGKLKRASHLVDKFPNVLPFFKKFIYVKNQFSAHDGAAKLRHFDGKALEFLSYFSKPSGLSEWPLGLLDLREVPGWLFKDDNVDSPYFSAFLNVLKFQKNIPTMSSPNVWVWITSSENRAVQALRFADKRMSKYICVSCAYTPSPNERLNLGTSRSKSSEVYLLFLIRKHHPRASALVEKVKQCYTAVDTSYYTERNKYLEACFSVHGSELRMEFYLELIKEFCKPQEKVFGVFSGSKFILANKVI